MTTAFAVGSLLAAAVSVFARVVGLDRDRAFYPTVLIVVASLYVLFAVMGGSREALIIELIIMSAFVACAVAGFRKSMWLVAAGLAGHGVLDFFQAGIVSTPPCRSGGLHSVVRMTSSQVLNEGSDATSPCSAPPCRCRSLPTDAGRCSVRY